MLSSYCYHIHNINYSLLFYPTLYLYPVFFNLVISQFNNSLTLYVSLSNSWALSYSSIYNFHNYYTSSYVHVLYVDESKYKMEGSYSSYSPPSCSQKYSCTSSLWILRMEEVFYLSTMIPNYCIPLIYHFRKSLPICPINYWYIYLNCILISNIKNLSYITIFAYFIDASIIIVINNTSGCCGCYSLE